MNANAPRRIGRFAATSNMTLALQTMHSAINAPEGVERIVLLYGPTGYGKTVAVTHVATSTDAVYIEITSLWTVKWFLTTLARELGLSYIARTSTEILDQVIAKINEDQRPLIIDEADFMLVRGSPEVLRDIYRATKTPIMLVGEESFPARIKRWERFDNRILCSTPAVPASLGDGHLLRDIYCERVAISDDLTDHFTQSAKGVTRRIVTMLQNAQSFAVETLESTSLDLATWQAARQAKPL